MEMGLSTLVWVSEFRPLSTLLISMISFLVKSLTLPLPHKLLKKTSRIIVRGRTRESAVRDPALNRVKRLGEGAIRLDRRPSGRK